MLSSFQIVLVAFLQFFLTVLLDTANV